MNADILGKKSPNCLLFWSLAIVMGVIMKSEAFGQEKFITSDKVKKTVDMLVQTYGDGIRDRAQRGVEQVAMFWREEDGTIEDFESFCTSQFVADPEKLNQTFQRFEGNLEKIDGYHVALVRKLQEPQHLDIGDPLPSDLLFASLNPFDHFIEDAFKSKVAFVALLNFPIFKVEELNQRGDTLSRKEWAEARLVQRFLLRIPGSVKQEATRAYTKADDYIANYNIFIGNLLSGDGGEKPFPEGGKLISHWGLRDHIKAMYNDPKANLKRQRLLLRVMERIITQEIPLVVINNDKVEWDPIANEVFYKDQTGSNPSKTREPDRRYEELLNIFKAERGIDRYSPAYPTLIDRKFGYEREMSEKRVEELLVSVLSAKVAKDVAKLIQKRVQRPLEAFDIWYDGFKERQSIPEELRTKAVQERYPNLEAFQKGILQILEKLGFSDDTARFLAGKIVVDPARGAGHAMGAGMREDNAHLRTRVPKGGMDYKGYNIALHELGHCVEQVFSLNRVDHTLLMGVPNTAFTEAFAFVFQSRDLEVLGLTKVSEKSKALKALDTFWMTFEISGVALLDMKVWRWMYDHPDVTPAELKEAVIRLAKEIWNTYYAPVLGVKDSPILAIYSHMIDAGLYLPDYPIGHIVEFQIEKAIEGKKLGVEMERMCTQGRLTPDVWMKNAVGSTVSSQPLIEATEMAVKVIK